MLDHVIEYFRRDLANEAMVVLCYNKSNGEFFLSTPEASVSKVSVDYKLKHYGKNILQVCQIHSHNTMSAVFSSVDDADEIMPGVYGVIGRLDASNPQINFRAGYEGVFTPLSVWDIFEEV